MKRGRLVRQKALCEDDAVDQSSSATTTRDGRLTFGDPDKDKSSGSWDDCMDELTSPDGSTFKILKGNASDGPSLFKQSPGKVAGSEKMERSDSSDNPVGATRGVATGKDRITISRSDTVVHVSKDRGNKNYVKSDSSEDTDGDLDNNNSQHLQAKTDKSDLKSSNSAFEEYSAKKNVAKALGIECDVKNRGKHLWARMPSDKK